MWKMLIYLITNVNKQTEKIYWNAGKKLQKNECVGILKKIIINAVKE